MSIPKEHDYIGLSEAPPSMGIRISDKFSSSSSILFSNEDAKTNNLNTKSSSFNLKETELRLGLPGSRSPDRKNPPFLPDVPLFAQDIIETNHTNNGFSLLSPLKNLVSGSKRGFSDAIDGVSSGKWVFSVGNGSEADLSKGAILLPPRGDNNSGNTQKSCMSGASMKEIAGVVNHPTNLAHEKSKQVSAADDNNGAPPSAKAQVVGWPPIRSFRKNSMASSVLKSNEDEGKVGYGCLYVKVSMDGAPYLRKVDLKNYSNYVQLSSALEKMFSCFTIGQCGSHGLGERGGLTESHLKDLLHGSEYILTYEDKDDDWMLVGDVPWEMFTESCRRMRIMKGSEAVGLAPRAIVKCKNTTVS